MSLQSKLKQSLQAQEDYSEGSSLSGEARDFSPEGCSFGDGKQAIDNSENGSSNTDETSESNSEQESDIKQQLNQISFASLARAQASLPLSRKRKRDDMVSEEQETKLATIRNRLQEIKNAKFIAQTHPSKSQAKSIKTKDPDQFSDNDSESSSNSDNDTNRKLTRTSKHAPRIQSSKRPVPRNRNVLAPSNPSDKALDPRFSSTISGRTPTSSTLRQRYAFLDSYRTQEMNDLRSIIQDSNPSKPKKKQKRATPTVDDATREKLKAELQRMENRARAEKERERREKVDREWKREEREKVRSGKKPFYLKEREKRERVEKDRWEGMKGKERERAERRKRKREGEKEMRRLPGARRVG
ncbi:MAG: rRNA biogenesis protein rrp36 [Bogoriella megaspora]|nr:MAG: rRNA biogenesis protein rrp36 [Bogoriella megaspora]